MKQPIRFGKYFLLERVNVGGMAEVFKAKTIGVEGFERTMAVKRILPTIAADNEFTTMFVDEAKIAVQLSHANIAQIFDLGKVDGAYFIALEYVSGKDLRGLFDRCKQRPEGGSVTMPIAQACFITMKVCEGLDYAHNKRDAVGKELHLVHRDVSPQNVLISYEGEVKLIDFGIAKAAGKGGKTQNGILKGKFGYMSPEQVRGLPLDRRSDIFAVGICLYEILTGERLFVSESDFSTLEKVRNVEILPPSAYNRKIPEELERIVLKALSKDVEDRYQNAIDLHDDLQAFMYTSGEFYSRKELSAWMKRTFAAEIAAERARDEQYRNLVATGADALAGAAPGSSAQAAPPSPGSVAALPDDDVLSWDDDELETHVYDTPPEEAAAGDADDEDHDTPVPLLDDLELALDGRPVPARVAPSATPKPSTAPSGATLDDDEEGTRPGGLSAEDSALVAAALASAAVEREPMPPTAFAGGAQAAVAEASPTRPPVDSAPGNRTMPATPSPLRRATVASMSVPPPQPVAPPPQPVAPQPRPTAHVAVVPPALPPPVAPTPQPTSSVAATQMMEAPELPTMTMPAPSLDAMAAAAAEAAANEPHIDTATPLLTSASMRTVKPPKPTWPRYAAIGGAALLLLGGGFYYFALPHGSPQPVVEHIAPTPEPVAKPEAPPQPEPSKPEPAPTTTAQAQPAPEPTTAQPEPTPEPAQPTAVVAKAEPQPAPKPEPAPKPVADTQPTKPATHAHKAEPKTTTVIIPKSTTPDTTPRPVAKAEPVAAPPPEPAKPAPPPQGFLRINSKPWTKIAVDGKDIGKNTPQMHLPLDPGAHRITLSNPQFGVNETFTLTIKAGQTETIVKDLRPPGAQ